MNLFIGVYLSGVPQGFVGVTGIEGPQGERGPTGFPGLLGARGQQGAGGIEVHDDMLTFHIDGWSHVEYHNMNQCCKAIVILY